MEEEIEVGQILKKKVMVGWLVEEGMVVGLLKDIVVGWILEERVADRLVEE